MFVLAEQSEHGELNTPTIRSSMDRWWANCVRNEDERNWIGEVIRDVRQSEDGAWTREKYVEALKRRKETGKLEEVSVADEER